MTDPESHHRDDANASSVAARLDALAERPLHEHAAVIEEIHQQLQQRLWQEQV